MEEMEKGGGSLPGGSGGMKEADSIVKKSKANQRSNDPYEVLATSTLCGRQGAQHNRPCVRNCWCVWGLGEKHDDGLFGTSPAALEALGTNPRDNLRERSSSGEDGSSTNAAALQNLGSTCYMNACLQVLSANLLFRNSILSFRFSSTHSIASTTSNCNGTEENYSPELLAMSQFVNSLQRVSYGLWRGVERVIDPSDLADVLELRRGVHQDVHEFQELLINKFSSITARTSSLAASSNDKPGVVPSPTSSINEGEKPSKGTLLALCEGRESQTLICQHCNADSISHQLFSDIHLKISVAHPTLSSALSAYQCQGEEFSTGGQWTCPKCKQTGDPMKNHVISHPPPVLKLHLTRYFFDRDTCAFAKDRRSVRVEETLVIGGEKYRCVGCVYHIGRSIHGGHYVCDVLDWESNLWRHCDDEVVMNVPPPWMEGGVIEELSIDVEDGVSMVDGPKRTEKDENEVENSSERIISIIEENTEDKRLEEIKIVDVEEEILTPPPKKKSRVSKETESLSLSGSLSRLQDVYLLYYVRETDFVTALSATQELPPQLILDADEARLKKTHLEIIDYDKRKAHVVEQLEKRKRIFCDAESFLNCATVEDLAVVPLQAYSDWLQCKPTTFHYLPTTVISSNSSGNSSCKEQNSEEIKEKEESESQKEEQSESQKEEQIEETTTAVDEAILPASSSSYLEYASQVSAAVQCPHGHLSPYALRNIKITSRKAADILSQDPFMAAALTPLYSYETFRCADCFAQEVDSREAESLVYSQTTRLLHRLEGLMRRKSPPIDGGFLVSTTWITSLRRFKERCDTFFASKSSSVGFSSPSNSITTSGTNVTQVGKVGSVEDLRRTVFKGVIPNSQLCCEHENLSPHAVKRTVLVSNELWSDLLHLFPSALEFKADSTACEACLNSRQQKASASTEKRQLRTLQRSEPTLAYLLRRRRLIPNVWTDPNYWSELCKETYDVKSEESDKKLNDCSIEGNPDEKLTSTEIGDPTWKEEGGCQTSNPYVHLIDVEWLENWRQFVLQGSPDVPSLSSEPLLCVHRKLLLWDRQAQALSKMTDLDISDLHSISHRDVSTRKGPAAVEVISPTEWSALSAHHGLSETPIDPVKMEWSRVKQKWTLSPPLCDECSKQSRAELEHQNRNFSDALLKVHFYYCPELLLQIVTGLEAGNDFSSLMSTSPESLPINADEDIGSADLPVRKTRRVTSRTRKSHFTTSVLVSANDRIGLVKLKIFEALSRVDVPPSTQRLFVTPSGQELLNNQRTLADYGVCSTDKLLVTDSREAQEHDQKRKSDDEGNVIDSWNDYYGQDEGAGFSNTALASCGDVIDLTF